MKNSMVVDVGLDKCCFLMFVNVGFGECPCRIE